MLYKSFINSQNNQDLITQQSYNYVIDDIDTLNAKVNLVKTAHQLGIKTISTSKQYFQHRKGFLPLPPIDPQPNQQGRSRATNGTLSYTFFIWFDYSRDYN
ncbi:MAG: hypothetical protein AB8U93_01830 [Francisella endosymbiont of Hyalomma scupense]